MKAIGKYIIIEPIEESNIKTEGGLILYDKQREDIRYRKARVINTGKAVNYNKQGDNI